MKNSNKGAALATVLIVLVVMSVLGSGLLTMSLGETKFAAYDEKRLQAYYVARAGAEAAANLLSTGANDDLIDRTEANTNFNPGSFSVKIDKKTILGSLTTEALIKSNGTVGNVTQKVNLILKKKKVLDGAVYVKNNMNLKNNTDIYGDVIVASGGSITGNTGNIHGSVTTGDLEVYPTPTPPVPAGIDDLNITSNLTLPSPSYPIPCTYRNINISSSTTLTVNLPGDTYIVADSITANNSSIQVNGTGILTVYTRVFTFKGNVLAGPNAKVIFKIYGSSPSVSVDLSTGSSIFQGMIYGPGVDMSISANTQLNGFIVANNINMSSGGSVTQDTSDNKVYYPEDLGLSSRGYSKFKWADG